MQSRQVRKILFVTDLWAESPYGVFTVVSNLKRELEKKGYAVDVLEPSQFFTVPFPLYKGVRLALFSWGSVRHRIAKGNYLRWFHAGARATIVSTPALKEQLHSFGLERVHVCPFGIDEKFFTRGLCPETLPKPVFLFFGRISSEKSVEEFLAADLPGTKLLIGDGPDRKKLEARFPGAKFVGFQRDDVLIAWCSCADVLVMPSRTETFGLTMVEALALGIPVAAHDVTGPREIVKDGVNGYLDEDITRAAKKCLSLSREVCRDSVRHYTWSASAETFISILESVHKNP